ncbi:hypothetical protein TKK_0002718 [Trichogramma kaykai]|uniref:D-3-phosphoglycerate dehydrogenase n=1 Tax=Trichogramma kaykai TaxID=54128 RepID=A0ABD2XR45_9HYME
MKLDVKSVFISDRVGPGCEALFKEHGVEVTTKYGLPKDELINELKKHDAVVVRSETKITADIIEAVPNLKMVGRAGTGTDNIDLTAATNNGVVVLNTPGGNSISACELTCGMIYALSRNIVPAGQSMKEGRWDRKLYSGFELYGKTLGVVGFGRIGREVAQRMLACGMKVVAYDPFLTRDEAKRLGVEFGHIDDIWRLSDMITFHTPLMPETKNLLNKDTLARCKRGVYVINVARGGIVDEQALLDSLEAGHCGGAALDVFSEEPIKSAHLLELVKHPRVVATPHLGASTAEAQERVAVEIAEQMLVLGGHTNRYPLTGVVNAPSIRAARNPELAPRLDLAVKLGELLGRMLPTIGEVDFAVTHFHGKPSSQDGNCAAALLQGVLQSRAEAVASIGVTPNLINSVKLGEKLKLKVREADCDKQGLEHEYAVEVRAGDLSVKGTCDKATKLNFLLNVNGADAAKPIPMADQVSLYKIGKPEDLAQVVQAVIETEAKISSIDNLADEFVLVQTKDPVDLAKVQLPAGVQKY